MHPRCPTSLLPLDRGQLVAQINELTGQLTCELESDVAASLQRLDVGADLRRHRSVSRARACMCVQSPARVRQRTHDERETCAHVRWMCDGTQSWVHHRRSERKVTLYYDI